MAVQGGHGGPGRTRRSAPTTFVIKQLTFRYTNEMNGFRFRKELGLILIVKLLLLTLVWWLCFSHPPSKTFNEETLIKRLLGKEINGR